MTERDELIAEINITITRLGHELSFYKKLLAFVRLRHTPGPGPFPPEEPKHAPSQKTLNMEKLPPEILEIVVPGQNRKAALRGPRERMPSEEWDKGMTGRCYKAFMEILRSSPDGAPVVHIVDICHCKNTGNAHAAKTAVLKNHPLDYVYVERKPWPMDSRKLRGIMHITRAKELGLEIIKLKEKEEPDADK